MSTRLKWLVDHGCIITGIYGVIEAVPRKIFAGFMNWVSDERRKGDTDQKYMIFAESCKTIGNLSFGRIVMDKCKHKNVKYADEAKFNQYKHKWTFHDSDQLNDVYEIILNKKSIRQNLPLQIGCSVFKNSKLKMYSFYYDFIDKYNDRFTYQCTTTDTNSAYMALAGNLNDLIKPKLRVECELNKYNWFPRDETLEHTNYDKRTPGLFKVEFEGVGAIALCSKAYYVWSAHKFKYSSKGTQKHRVALMKEQYFKCLNLKEFIMCNNVGFRRHNGAMCTYEQKKIGLTPIYTKGVVINNEVNIVPLNI